MPTPTKYRNNSSLYGTRYEYKGERLYSGTGTAYDIPIEYPPRRQTSIPLNVPQKKVGEKPVRETRKAVRINKKRFTRFALCVCMFFALCFTVLYRYAIILQSNQEIRALEDKMDAIVAENQTLQTKIDKQLEISEIERVAGEELGMMKPQAYQIFYIDMDMSDGGNSGTISTDVAGSMQGVPGALVNAFRVLK